MLPAPPAATVRPFASAPAEMPSSSISGIPAKPGCVVPSIVSGVGDRRKRRGWRDRHVAHADRERDRVRAAAGVGGRDGRSQRAGSSVGAGRNRKCRGVGRLRRRQRQQQPSAVPRATHKSLAHPALRTSLKTTLLVSERLARQQGRPQARCDRTRIATGLWPSASARRGRYAHPAAGPASARALSSAARPSMSTARSFSSSAPLRKRDSSAPGSACSTYVARVRASPRSSSCHEPCSALRSPCSCFQLSRSGGEYEKLRRDLKTLNFRSVSVSQHVARPSSSRDERVRRVDAALPRRRRLDVLHDRPHGLDRRVDVGAHGAAETHGGAP